ncbi:sigma factor-like helix-turn-helix DNA-binding protein [Nonomuraea fuscirosea]|uniref:sigma factor-like helix-turn-helix DNA-binding protein n=1 Tax=Nonomuraea fuscirosea TaxID=1291556 RepID=UPI0033FD0EFA
MEFKTVHPPPGSPGAEGSADTVVAELFLVHRLALVRLAFLWWATRRAPRTGSGRIRRVVSQVERVGRPRAGAALPAHGRGQWVPDDPATQGDHWTVPRLSRGSLLVGEGGAAGGDPASGVSGRAGSAATPARGAGAAVLLDLSVAEIAQVLGVSRGTVKSTASRALRALAAKLVEER